MTTNPIPEGFHTVTPYLIVEGVASVLEFLANAFDAETRGTLTRPEGSVMHAEVKIGDSMVMMGEPMGEFGPMPGSVFLYFEDCDAAFARAVGAGGAVVMDVTTMEHAGVRYGGVKDTAGNIWWIATHLENIPWADAQYRIDAVAGQDLGR